MILKREYQMHLDQMIRCNVRWDDALGRMLYLYTVPFADAL